LEITDVNNWYLKRGRLKAIKLEGYWSDAGTFSFLVKGEYSESRLSGPKDFKSCEFERIDRGFILN